MAFGDITMANLVYESKEAPGGGRISKIAQPEKDELLMTIKNNKENYRLQVSTNASLPLIYLTDKSKPSPTTVPNFCMLSRKHIGSARIVDIGQPSLEHIIQFDLEHLGEVRDLYRKKLIVEIMGKHSNIIFYREDGTIIDSIKHVSAQVGSIREVLPGRSYFIPQTVVEENPLTVTQETFYQTVGSSSMSVQKALYSRLTDISPIMAEEVCHLASIDSDYGASELSEAELLCLYYAFSLMMGDVKEGNFAPAIVFDEGGPVEYVALSLTCYKSDTYHSQSFRSVSRPLEEYHVSRGTITRIRQESSDLRWIVQTFPECNYKKYDLRLKQLKDTEKRGKYRIYGKLLGTYGYKLTGDEESFTYLNCYTNEEITVPLDTQLSAKDSARRRFGKYNKLERICEALTDLIKETKAEIDHLESISSALDIVLAENDLVRVKEELVEYEYIKKRRPSDKKPKATSKPFHYISSDGFHIYVGENNCQNEELTFKLATDNDQWLHAKGIPDSHVIIKAEGCTDLPGRLFEETGSLAAYYSKGCDNDKVEIDYIQKKNIKKTTGAAPEFVTYHTNCSLVTSPGYALNEVERLGFEFWQVRICPRKGESGPYISSAKFMSPNQPGIDRCLSLGFST